MIYKVPESKNENNELIEITDKFDIGEIELEKLISFAPGEQLNTEVFGEELLFLGRQFHLGNKYFDMLALDRYGHSVIIELKKCSVVTSTAMQALDYMNILGSFKDEKFIQLIKHKDPSIIKTIEQFVNKPVELNHSSKIILVGQSFHPSLLSLGRWISEKGTPFKCIQYTPVLLENRKYLIFSNIFSASKEDEYARSLEINPVKRKPKKFWHILNDGTSNQEWWDYWKNNNIICLNYDNREDQSCSGFRKMNDYIVGDQVYIWAKGEGFVGHGQISGEYQFKSSSHNVKGIIGYSHTRPVKWINIARSLSNAIENKVLSDLGIRYPRQGKQQILQGLDKLAEIEKLLNINEAPSQKKATENKTQKGLNKNEKSSSSANTDY